MTQALKRYKSAQKRKSTKRLKDVDFPKDLIIVSEGDSWFDYPARKDVLDFLIHKGFAIKRFSKYGDTLENMAYGTNFKKDRKTGKYSHKGPESLHEVHNAVKKYKPAVFLLSAGGNDIVGTEISAYLNHKHSKPSELLNRGIFEERLVQMSIAIENYIKQIHRIHKKCHILMDGYDYAKVNGVPYKFAKIKLAGPWILPSMAKKAITEKKYQTDIVKDLVDGFNDVLSSLSSKYSYFHFIDIRNEFPDEKDWHNEIHLNKSAYQKLAGIYATKINEVLKYDPVLKYESTLMT